MINFLIMGRSRMTAFKKDFLSQFSEMHYDAMKTSGKSDKLSTGPDPAGYPDCGNGFYSEKWDYGTWFTFNVRSRTYKNFLDVVTPAVVFLLIGGLEIPWISIGAGILFFISRLAYTIGYIK